MSVKKAYRFTWHFGDPQPLRAYPIICALLYFKFFFLHFFTLIRTFQSFIILSLFWSSFISLSFFAKYLLLTVLLYFILTDNAAVFSKAQIFLTREQSLTEFCWICDLSLDQGPQTCGLISKSEKIIIL